jgi:GntR family transcriptional regulator
MKAQRRPKPAQSFQVSQAEDPMYRRVQSDLATKIKTGELREGEALPSEDTLCKLYGVSRITVRRALDELRAEHYIETRTGSGSFVTRPPRVFHGTLPELISGAWDSRIFVSEKWGLPPQIVQDELNISADAKVKIWETALVDRGHPMLLSKYFLPKAVGDLIEREDILRNRSIMRAIEEKLDEKVTRAIQTIEPGIANAHVAKHLQIPEKSPVLRIVRTYFRNTGKPLYFAIVHGHPKLYRYTIELVAR